MKIDRTKAKLVMARACLRYSDVVEKSKIPHSTVVQAMRGRPAKPYTVGRIAKALNVDVEEILVKEG